MNFELHPSARQELVDAVEYYRQISPRLGNSFVDEFESAVNRIISFPQAWPKLSKNTRRCRINHFPYGIIYYKPLEGTVAIDRDVREYFPDAEAVNNALRGLIALIPKKHEPQPVEETELAQTEPELVG